MTVARSWTWSRWTLTLGARQGSEGPAASRRRAGLRPSPDPLVKDALTGDTESVAVMDLEELKRRAAALGHTNVRVNETRSGRRFTAECSCGWGAPQSNGKPSKTYAVLAEALKSARWHLETAVKVDALRARRRDGRSSA